MASSAGTIDAAAVVSRWNITGHDDLTAVDYVPAIDRVVVIADSDDRLLVLGPDGTVENDVPIPGQQQEGVAFDASGAMWIADDKDKSVLRLHEGLLGLQSHLRGEAPSPAPSGGGGPAEFIEKKNPLK
jgi:hypothetical protein